MDVFVEWLDGPLIVPRVVVGDVAEFEEIDVQPCLGLAYQHRDAVLAARAGGRPVPPNRELLSAPQSAALTALSERWSALEERLAECFDPLERPLVSWSLVEVTNRIDEDHAVLRVGGVLDTMPETAIAGWVSGDVVHWAGRLDAMPEAPGQASDPTPPRPNPAYETVTAQRVLDLARDGEWRALEALLSGGGASAGPLLQQLVLWVVRRPADDWRASLDQVASVARAVEPGANYFRPGLLEAPERLRALREAGLVRLEPGMLHTLDRPDHLERLVELGLPIDAPLGDDPRQTPLVTHRDNPQAFRRLLELGADTSVLEDGVGGVRYALGPPQRLALRRARPDLDVPDPPEALLARRDD